LIWIVARSVFVSLRHFVALDACGACIGIGSGGRIAD
jgi:hypothetical protein